MMTEILKVFIQLFLIIDPFNVVPIFSMVDRRKVKQVARDAVIVAFGLLLFFAILGDILLRALDISLCSFMI
ncbi:MAG TPA: MarC family protein, partial [Candidatus Bathyarchaeota archaeon]|nr:MarC family protein [Candidatus Bathyarchaeota archaeon]